MAQPFDITTVPSRKLLNDMQDSVCDMRLCELAIEFHLDYPGLQERLLGNQKIIAAIDAELTRRQNSQTESEFDQDDPNTDW